MSKDFRDFTVSTDSVAQDQLQAFIERIERMEEEKKAISDDIKEIYAEAAGNGFDSKVLRQVIRIRKQDHAERMEQEAILELYMSALGMGYTGRYHDNDEDARPSRARAHVRESWNVDENGDGPTRRMTKARQAIFDTLEVEGIIAGRDTGRCVYFLHAPDAGVLKIGSSDDVMKRVKSLQGSSPVPLVLLGSIGGGLEHELELHGLFADRRVHGEWFTADDEFLTNIRWRIAHGANPSTAVDIDGGSENAPATVDTSSRDGDAVDPLAPPTVLFTSLAGAEGDADRQPNSNLLHMPAPKPQFVQVPFEGAINT